MSRLPARVLLPSGERPAPTEAGAETGAAERHWRSLTPRHAVLEWMWEQITRSREGPVSPNSRRKSQRRRCWFGAVGRKFPPFFLTVAGRLDTIRYGK